MKFFYSFFSAKWTIIIVLTFFVGILSAVSLKLIHFSPELSEKNAFSQTPLTPAVSTPSNIIPEIIYPPKSWGYAISWPQCNKEYPTDPFDFGVIGVTGGRSFTHNPCFQSEYKWAFLGKFPPSFYINMDYPGYMDNKFMKSFPCSENDEKCIAYHYGFESAKDAYNYASTEHASPLVWWLDVQIISSWSGNKTTNSKVILGAIDFFKSQNIPVGLSTTPYQWKEITGDLQTGLPNWIPGIPDKDKAREYCAEGESYSGGYIRQLAYIADHFEEVYSCGK